MGRIIFLILIIATVIMLWKAFAPQHLRSGNARRPKQSEPRSIAPKGPDDDPDFLWNIKKERFKEQRRREEELRKEEQRRINEQRLNEQRSNKRMQSEEARNKEVPGKENPKAESDEDPTNTPKGTTED